jgi:hypothetical protein
MNPQKLKKILQQEYKKKMLKKKKQKETESEKISETTFENRIEQMQIIPVIPELNQENSQKPNNHGYVFEVGHQFELSDLSLSPKSPIKERCHDLANQVPALSEHSVEDFNEKLSKNPALELLSDEESIINVLNSHYFLKGPHKLRYEFTNTYRKTRDLFASFIRVYLERVAQLYVKTV